MHRRSVLIVVQNLPVPMDRRVWLEAKALRDAGYDVAVICPKGPGDASFEVLENISLYKYANVPATSGLLSYLAEFIYCWIRTALLSVKVFRKHRFQVLQACNPPDTFWLLGRFWKLFGVSYVFDQHDLNPELFRSRFGEPTSLGAKAQFKVLTWLERRTYRTADHVIVTNESYRKVALQRGELDPKDVTVVRSGPDTTRMRPVGRHDRKLPDARYLLAYLGIMGPQDNVHILLEAMEILVKNLGRRDTHLVLMGFGDCADELQAQARRLGLSDFVTFTGRADQTMIAQYLSSAHIGLSPDLKTPLNDVSTHNKTMEYMAYALPIVSFDLIESQVSSGDCSVYVDSGDVKAYAQAIDELLEDDERRMEMGRRARSRCVSLMDWQPQSEAYVGVFDGLFGVDRNMREVGEKRRRQFGELPAHPGGAVIDLRDPMHFESFLRTRGLSEVLPGTDAIMAAPAGAGRAVSETDIAPDGDVGPLDKMLLE